MHQDIEKILVPADEINARIEKLAGEMDAALPGDDITMLVVMTGAFVFAADLVRKMQRHIRIEPVVIRSYCGEATRSSENCEIKLFADGNIAGRDILIVDDIFDSGNTLASLTQEISKHSPASLHTCMLLEKYRPDLPGRAGKVDWTGFEIPDKFVVGYGLDFNGLYRNLPYIGVLKQYGGKG